MPNKPVVTAVFADPGRIDPVWSALLEGPFGPAFRGLPFRDRIAVVDSLKKAAQAAAKVSVRPSQIAAARLSIEISEELGDPVSPAMRTLAAMPLPGER